MEGQSGCARARGSTKKKRGGAAPPWRWGQGQRPAPCTHHARGTRAPRHMTAPAASAPGRGDGHRGPHAVPAAEEASGVRHESVWRTLSAWEISCGTCPAPAAAASPRLALGEGNTRWRVPVRTHWAALGVCSRRCGAKVRYFSFARVRGRKIGQRGDADGGFLDQHRTGRVGAAVEGIGHSSQSKNTTSLPGSSCLYTPFVTSGQPLPLMGSNLLW
jgi:hypothetical protein